MSDRLRGPSVAFFALVLGVTAGCDPAAPAASSSPVASVISTPTAEAPTSAELEAIEFRRTYGLPADLTHVREVAANPRATTDDFGIPLTPEEVLRLRVRGASDNVRLVVSQRVEQYPNDFCGDYIDRANGGAYTSMWRANLEGHRSAILFQVGPEANVAFVGCTYSELELEAVKEGIREDYEWMREIPALPTSWGAATIENRVEMQISSAVPNAADLVRRHYEESLDLPTGILVVTSDGTGVALVPRGFVRIFVLLPNGNPVGPNDLSFNWGPLDLPGLRCGVGDIGYGVSWNGGATRIPCQEGRWAFSVEGSPGPDQDFISYGRGEVVVHAGKTVELTITLDRKPPSRE